jgi:hypothetical protein
MGVWVSQVFSDLLVIPGYRGVALDVPRVCSEPASSTVELLNCPTVAYDDGLARGKHKIYYS